MSLLDFLKPMAASGNPLTRENIAAVYLAGDGIEVGALHLPLKVSAATRVRYVDRMPVAELRRQYPELAEANLLEPDVIDDGERLGKIGDGSQDFVIANHFIEHCQDPIGAIGNFLRVLKAGGVLYLAVPDKRYTFDRDREPTPLEHLRRDHREGPAWSRGMHFEQWVREVNKVQDEAEARAQIAHYMEIDYSIHYHCWTQEGLLELIGALRGEMGFEVELFLKNGEECVFILRKA